MDKIEVFIADDQRLMREGLSLLLDNQPDVVVVGEAYRGADIQKSIQKLKPDILLLDMTLVQSGEIPSISELNKLSPQTRIIMLSNASRDEHVHHSLNEGARGFIAKQAPSSEIPSAIHFVMNNHYFLSPSIMNRVVETYLEGTRTKPRGRCKGNDRYRGYNQLSEREKEVFFLLLEGYSSKDISKKLDISSKTADKHRTNIFQKIGVENSTQLLHYAIDLGLTRINFAI